MGKKPATIKKDKVLSINLSDGKEGGIRKKIQCKASQIAIESFSNFAKEIGLNSRDEIYNTYLDLTLRFCAPLPTDEPLNDGTLFLFNRLIDWELIYQQDLGVAKDKDREELKLYFLFMLQPFSDERIKKEDYRKMEKIKKRFNYGKTIYQVLNYIVLHYA